MCREGKPAEAFSRKGHVLPNYTRIVQALSLVQRNSPYKSLVFDGEVIAGDFFSTRGVMKLPGNEAKNAVYHAFDVVLGNEWEMGATEQFRPRNQRLLRLSKGSTWLHQFNLKYVPTYLFRPEQVNWQFFGRVRNWLMQQGYEGLIVRPNVGYNFDTRSSLFKLKKMDTEDCTLVEVLPGEEGKKHAHHAGRVLIELPWGGTCKAGLKMTDAQRDELWANRKKFVGMTVEVAYQEKTVNQDNEPKLQFPVMIGFREDKS
jgi:ATP-dependent DNA ligase